MCVVEVVVVVEVRVGQGGDGANGEEEEGRWTPSVFSWSFFGFRKLLSAF